MSLAAGPRGHSTPRRLLSIAEQQLVRTALDRGTISPRELATMFDCSVRTIYRYAAEDRAGRLAFVELAGYRALVRLAPGMPPAFLSRWELAR